MEELLWRAALLAGHGRQARMLAHDLALIARVGQGRSCLDGGSSVQLTVDAPGNSALRIGVRLSHDVNVAALAALTSRVRAEQFSDALQQLQPDHAASLGGWLFWSTSQQSLYVDLRDPDPREAEWRLRSYLNAPALAELDKLDALNASARLWAVRIDADERRRTQVHVHWLLHRHASIAAVAETLAPGSWPRARPVFNELLRHPSITGRWTVSMPLSDASARPISFGNSGWSIVSEDDAKHRAIGRVMSQLAGPRDYAEALWCICRSGTSERWRVGRACEVSVSEDDVGARLYFVPEPEGRRAGCAKRLAGSMLAQ
jgi:hypothetical protein